MEELRLVLDLVIAALLGAIVGYERLKEGKEAGLRTHALTALGAALFTIVSVINFGITDSSARIMAAIITGIGFIGAGTIIFNKERIRGLTTAASLWVVAGIGVAVAFNYYILAVSTSILVFFILRLKDSRILRA